MAKKQSPSVRLQLTLRQRYAQIIQKLQGEDEKSQAEVVREALNLLYHVTEVKGDDGKMYVEQPDGTKIYIILP